MRASRSAWVSALLIGTAIVASLALAGCRGGSGDASAPDGRTDSVAAQLSQCEKGFPELPKGVEAGAAWSCITRVSNGGNCQVWDAHVENMRVVGWTRDPDSERLCAQMERP
jgi:outer membrane murein-binding lipoprotein Lpp